ncbi:MAG: ion channel [Rhodobacterales bacterium]
MSIAAQILLGSIILGLCSLIHIIILVWSVSLIRILQPKLTRFSARIRLGLLISKAFFFVVMAHSIEVWVWAFSFDLSNAVPNIGEAVYFALTTYTTLGYGDITLSEGFRVYAAMASVNGLLNFGLSTAFLVGLLARMLPDDIR